MFAGIEWSLVRFRVSGLLWEFYRIERRCDEAFYRHVTAIRDSIVVSISACHADDPGSIPGRGDFALTFLRIFL